MKSVFLSHFIDMYFKIPVRQSTAQYFCNYIVKVAVGQFIFLQEGIGYCLKNIVLIFKA